MNDDSFFELSMGVIIIAISLGYMLPYSMFITAVLTGATVLGVFLVLRGIIELIIGKGTSHLMMGAALCFMLMVLFNGSNAVMRVFSLILSIFGL